MKLFDKGNGKHENKGLDDGIDTELNEQEQLEIQQRIRQEVEQKRKQKEIEALQNRIKELKNGGNKPKLEAAKPAPSNGKHKRTIEQNPQGLYYLSDMPNVLYDAGQMAEKLREEAHGPIPPPSPIKPLDKPKFKGPLGKWIKGKERDQVVYEPVINETINLQAHALMPNSEKLLFIDPKAIALTISGVPAMKQALENMSRPIAPKKPIDPKLLIGIGIMAFIVAISLVVIYNSWIAPAQAAERAYDLKVRQNGGNTTGIDRPGGGLFHFELPNPMAPCPTCPGGSQYKGN